MKISKAHTVHMQKIARLGGLAVKKKMPKGYFSKIAKRGWRLRRKKEAML